MDIKQAVILALTRGNLNVSVLSDVVSPSYQGLLYDVRDPRTGQSAVVSVVVRHEPDRTQLSLVTDVERERGHAVPASIYLGSGAKLHDPNA